MKNASLALIWKLVLLAVLGMLAACSSSDSLTVRQFHLHSVEPTDKDAQMVRGEQMYRLRGAVTLEERKERLGQYYTVGWKNEQPGGASLKVVMDYQQAATAAKVLRMSRDLPSHEREGSVEFKITGENYRMNGKVIAWRIRLLRGNEIVAEKRSYLWR